MRLQDLHCSHISPGTPAMADSEARALLAQLPGWAVREGALRKRFSFAGYGETVAFANAVAWIATREDHHPDMLVSYQHCEVAFSTHTVKGISMNDFICAARVEALL
jgi:4a-hydroxytetrahydrobiopterin dehydratase